MLVCSLSDFDQTSRKRLTVKDRDIFIIKDQGNYYALDSFCYRMYKLNTYIYTMYML